ncbi:HIRAN domain-containing protein [Enterococcus sp. 669A]|uniref:HIRAN domain-containing protein n=1 Tax=Candidatus Enterococcus moelleringii TaxID=2815325 RepID=A0ABS3LK48_9ENTE|nr:HIRAN domain-containing protein [Enterococcus sp. 669A]MBO1308734.1 HIRAN domain-containing protein [Enterococcus sp. 669A]
MLKQLCLLWQNKTNRRWYHIGNLNQNEDGTYTYEYTTQTDKGDLQEALQDGYFPHPAFPDLNKVYHSEKLFNAFSRRLPSRNRKDYDFLFEIFDLQEDKSDFALLEFTGGSVYTDGYEFVKPVEEHNGLFEIDCFLRGWRYYNNEIEQLTDSDELVLVIDEENQYDQNAVGVVKLPDNKRIGYVPAFYTFFIKNVLKHHVDIRVDYDFYPEADFQYKVRLRLTGEIPRALIFELKKQKVLFTQ